MLTTEDWAQMAADLVKVRGDNEVNVVIRRGDSTLGAQPVRIARKGGSGRWRDSTGAQQVTGQVIVMGGTTLDIRPGDRFNDDAGVLYEVVLVRPNCRAAVIAEAEVVE